MALAPGNHDERGKPATVTFADGRTEQATTWRKLAGFVLEDCGRSPEYRERLMGAKDIVSGKKRKLLSGDPSELDRPLKIADGLYFESYFDTGYLFKQLTYVLDLAGYDYSGIMIQLREPKQEQETEQEPEETSSGPSMSM